MQSITTLKWSRSKKNTNSAPLERIVELRVISLLLHDFRFSALHRYIAIDVVITLNSSLNISSVPYIVLAI